MNLVFDCLEVLGISQECNFFGEVTNWRNVQSYNGRGRVSGDLNQSLIAPAWSGMSGLMTYTSGVMPIYCQSVFLGTGKITSLSFDAGTDVRDKIYNISFEILRSGDLSKVTGALYTGITDSYSFLPYLNSLSETYEYNQSNNLNTDFTRNISFDFEKGYFDRITGAHNLGVNILSKLVHLGAYSPLPPPHYTGVEGMTKSLSQNIDTINGSFSFSESYTYQSGIPWVHEYSHSLNYGQDGITTVSEAGTIQSNRRTNGTGERIQYAISGWNVVKTGIYLRVTDVFNRWNDQFQDPAGCPLDNEPFQKNYTKDYYRGLVSYNYSYNNDPAAESGYYNSYEQNLSMNAEGWIEVNVNGNIRSRQTEPSGALDSIYSLYDSQIRPSISGYAVEAYNDSINFFKSPFCSGGYSGKLQNLNSEETYNEYPASISYNFGFSDDAAYIFSGGFKKIKNTVSNQEVTSFVNLFRIPNYLELAQNSFQTNLGVLTNSIEIIGSENTTLNQYKALASGNFVYPTGTYWKTAQTFNLNPFSNQFTMNVEFAYQGWRAMNNYTL